MDFSVLMLALPLIGIVGDIVMGYAAAAYNGEVDSKVMKRGIFGKLAEVAAIGVAFLLQWAFVVFGPELLGVSADIPIGTTACAYVLLTEVVSIIENIGCMNPTLARWLTDKIGISPEKVHLTRKEGDDGDDK